uniref:thiol:disulfide interchange protein DsbA/DsbL n=1 Tax=Ningiella ruwaisensis TaxID=2364274 RepID=UPI0010A06A36|nr:thiol:disulfide interchange protein DsbA/DsbL [Ningiella ruwaisensis]
MKKYLVAMTFASLMALGLSAHAFAQVMQWEEGKHYEVIAEEATAKPEVKEFFSFWCPACYRFEAVVPEIKKALPEGVKFEKVHVNFMRFAGADVQDAATKAMMIGKSLKKQDQLAGAIFNYIHEQRATVTGLDDLRKVFIVNGVEAEDFDKQAKSFSVNSLVARNNNAVSEYREHLSGVPNFIVNGKYQVNLGSVQTMDEIVDLIAWLAEQK